MIANYGTGAVAVMPVDEDGRLRSVSQLVPLDGTPGPDPRQQASSHPHAVIFDPDRSVRDRPGQGLRPYLLLPVPRRPADTDGPGRFCQIRRPGAAPRHATFHPTLPVLYVNNELDSTVTVFDWTAGGRPSGR